MLLAKRAVQKRVKSFGMSALVAEQVRGVELEQTLFKCIDIVIGGQGTSLYVD